MTGARYNSQLITLADALRDPAEALPVELVWEVFRKLDFAGRLAVSHVCRSWRLCALSDGHLWTQWQATDFAFFPNGQDTMTATLTEMLARSSPLPFSLECDYDVPDHISDLVVSNAWRLEVLVLAQLRTDDLLERILAQDVPVLRHFTFNPYINPDKPMTLPTRWATAPFLESLSIGRPCIWPPGCTIPTLRSFSGYVPDTPGAYAPLSAMFPNVTKLTLDHLTEELLSRLEPLPHSLTALILLVDDGIDFATLLRGWKTTALRKLTIDWASNTACTLEVFRLFLCASSGPWALYSYRAVADLRAPPGSGIPSHGYSVRCTTDFWYDHAAEIIPLCNRLCELILPLVDLLPLCAAHAVFPALTTVQINLDKEEHGLLATLQDRPLVHAPALRHVVVDAPACREFDGRSAEIAVPIVRVFSSPRLASVVIRTHENQPFPCKDASELADLAECVEAQDSVRDVLHVYTAAAEHTVSATS